MRIAFRTDSQPDPPRKVGDRESPRYFTIALCVVLGVFFLSVLGSVMGDGGLNIIYQQYRIKRDLEARIAAEEARQERLLTRVAALRNDPLELERVAREELGLVKDGEIVFDFREPGPR